MAGFSVTQVHDYFLPRAKVSPPESLVRAVWPWVDQWLTWFGEKQGELPAQPAVSYDQIDLEPGAEESIDDIAA